MRVALVFGILCCAVAARAEVKYQNDLEKLEPGPLPDEFLVLAGNFEVRSENGNKFIELPGSPLDTYSFLFGPSMKENAAASARIFGTAQGRRYPAFDIGLNGAGGYKLRASPGKRQLELIRGDELKTSAPLNWKSGKWTHLKLEVKKMGENQWKIAGKFWQEGEAEPAEAAISFLDSEPPVNGRASVTGMPYSGKPIRFDDLKVETVR